MRGLPKHPRCPFLTIICVFAPALLRGCSAYWKTWAGVAGACAGANLAGPGGRWIDPGRENRRAGQVVDFGPYGR